ncbi:hypothetical protein [Azospirillum canadense]|uniref:hypothetical protein n=1 Tax=Azospirillum canadense TaxID=403962 RepID=UPI002226FD37|nr:hypothetical protein [Azospirillum canadense]MCW2242405.1 hypothetical protein [Azospirillum canadense]
MTGHTLRRLWNEDATCGFCLHAEPGGAWCTGMCRDLSLTDVVKRVRAVRVNVVRLEAVKQGVIKTVKPHVVPRAPATAGEHAAQRRSTAVEHAVDSLQRARNHAVLAELTAHRLRATRAALAVTRDTLAKNRPSADG